MMPLTLQYGTFTFPNQTFKIVENPFQMDTPIFDIQRKIGGVVEDGFPAPKVVHINGKIYGTDKGSVSNELNILQMSVHNKGLGSTLIYRDGWQMRNVHLAPAGFVATPASDGTYEFAYIIDIFMATADPFVESVVTHTASGSMANDTQSKTLNNAGHFMGRPIFTFVAGTWDFSNQLSVLNVASSHTFQYEGPIVAGQTLVVDCDGGCVLLQEGVTMVNAMSYSAGDIFMDLEPGDNLVLLTGATIGFSIAWKDREYV